MQYSLNEVCLLPSSIPTDISSRSQVYPYRDGKLPIFVAPMTSVISKENISLFDKSNVIPILPRNTEDKVKECIHHWVAFSLEEFIHYFNACEAPDLEIGLQYHVLIDVANGHMKKIYDCVKDAKEEYGDNIQIMVGNIAHPSMYKYCCEAGVDYVRCNIGSNVCTNSVETVIHCSHLSIIEGIRKLSCYYEPTRTKIIADGNINTIDKAIKCLGIGYDYVMMDKCFAECEEACGETRILNFTQQPGLEQNEDGINWYPEPKYITVLQRKYYGMASEQGQKDISGGICKNSKSVTKWVDVTTNLKEFVSRFEALLRSAMSYTGSHNLCEFRRCQYDIQSVEEFKSYYK